MLGTSVVGPGNLHFVPDFDDRVLGEIRLLCNFDHCGGENRHLVEGELGGDLSVFPGGEVRTFEADVGDTVARVNFPGGLVGFGSSHLFFLHLIELL